MTTEQFAYWLQGFSEIHGAPPSAAQWEMIKEHLQTCFKKVTTGGHVAIKPDQDPIPLIIRNMNQQQISPLTIGDVPSITC